ncbi:MAG: cation:proton antiporter [Phycisphaerae bacterium]|nr:cation:proton antiporter [Phycisphaerae bacterium]
MDLWTALLDVLILLFAALALGALCERLGQSAILGYLLAGTLLGPNAYDMMTNHRAVTAIAELGVALLLFTIGLEFSWRRLRRIGPIAIGGGTLQVLLTGAVAGGACLMLGLGGSASVAVGAMIALSSTACVLRVLVSRAEIDSVHGRNALGILLLQDISLIPLVLIVTALGGEGTTAQIAREMGRAIGGAAILVAVFYVLFKYLVPLILSIEATARNRELTILLAIVMAVGSAWAAHRVGFSPALGAFVAGMLLASSPFATQVRADVVSLRTLFVTLFFSSIGMLADPVWAVEHWATVLALVGAIVIGKAVLAGGVTYLFRASLGHAVATGVCLAQVGEFSVVLTEVARHRGLIDGDLFKLIISATIITLFLTPYLVAVAPRLARAAGRLSARGPRELPPRGGAWHRRLGGVDTAETAAPDSSRPDAEMTDHIVIVGFGPAGQRVAETLMRRHKPRIVVLEQNPKTATIARTYELQTFIGDATRTETLEELRVGAAKAVAVTVPDPTTARHVIEGIRSLSPQTPIIARSRYHIHRWQLTLAGAQVVIDEEDHVGARIALEVRRVLRAAGGEPSSTNDAT